MIERPAIKALIIVVVLFLLVFALSPDTVKCNTHTRDIVSYDGILEIEYEAPVWLTGHSRQCEIEEYISQVYTEMLTDAEDLKDEFPDTALLPYSLDIQIDRLVIDPYESILINRWAYTGGAHGNSAYTYYNLKDNENIAFSAYLQDIGYEADELLAQINQQLEKDGFRTLEGFNEPQASHPDSTSEISFPWHIYERDDGGMGITVIFPPYFVGSYAQGTPTYSF